MLWIAEVAKRESVSAIQPSKVGSSAFGAGSDVNHGDLHGSPISFVRNMAIFDMRTVSDFAVIASPVYKLANIETFTMAIMMRAVRYIAHPSMHFPSIAATSGKGRWRSGVDHGRARRKISAMAHRLKQTRRSRTS